MSVCWHIVCKETKQQLWCGQSSYLYKTDEMIELLEAFLRYHEYKPLQVENDMHWNHDDVECADWAGVLHDWEILVDEKSLGVYRGNLLEAIRAALAEHFPGAEFYPPTMYCSAGELTFNPTRKEEYRGCLEL